MLNAGQQETTRPDEDVAPSEEPPAASTSLDGHGPPRRLRLWASLLGLLGAVLSLAVPFLPVTFDIGTLKWPTAEGTKPVSAPLVSFSPNWLDTSFTCDAARSLDQRTNHPANLISTNPPNSDYGKITGLIVQIDRGTLSVLSKGQQLGTTELPPGPCSIAVHSDASKTTVKVGDHSVINIQGQDRRPQLTGIYSDLDAKLDNIQGVSFQARVDNRFESSATALKIAAMIGAVLCAAGSIFALRRLDQRAGRRPPKLAPRGWWKPTLRDVAVVLSLGVWWLIGAMTSDDGYILTIARARESAGFVSNYFRWFANPEAPFGWFYELYSAWVQISTATPWVRLPALIMGLVSWLLISREVLPRLGQDVRRSNAAGWAAAAVFLMFWLPYDNGLRPEPVVVLFSLLTLCAVERAVATKRLMPAALGLIGAALSVGANPHGMVAVLPYIAAVKPLLRMISQRAKQFGWIPVLAPIAASGLVILCVVFSDQTWQSVMDGIQLKTDFGPSDDWYQELNRYNQLFSQAPDGSLTRRFPVLLVMLCLATCAVVLLRRGKIRGAALGPSRRLLAVAALSFVVLALTPTKWSHHFGVFAAVGGALAALTALATSSTVLRSKRNRAAFFAGLMVVLAFSVTGTNGWWYVSGWGVPWYDKPPSYHGHSFSTLLLCVAAIAMIVAFIEHLRLDEHRPKVIPRDKNRMEKQSRALRLGTAPLSIICALLIVGELVTFGKAVQKQWDSYSLGMDNIKQLTGNSCGLSDYVDVETNPQGGILQVSANQPTVAAPDTKVPRRDAELEKPNDYLKARNQGFETPGVPPEDPANPQGTDWKPPYGFGTDKAPVWGSYEPTGTRTGELRTPWYDIPDQARTGKAPVVLSMAGWEWGANSLIVEFGKDTDKGFQTLQRYQAAQSPGGPWRDHRFNIGPEAQGATKMRIVATDEALGPQGWVAVSAPRVPQMTDMTKFIGDAPTFIEWPAALVYPCQQIPSISHGIAEMPKFRIRAGMDFRDMGQGWSSPEVGGPFGWMNVTSSMRALPTYLKGDYQRDWGSLYEVDPYEPGALPPQTALDITKETHWGTWSPGALSEPVQLPGDVPRSDDRSDVKGFGNKTSNSKDDNQ